MTKGGRRIREPIKGQNTDFRNRYVLSGVSLSPSHGTVRVVQLIYISGSSHAELWHLLKSHAQREGVRARQPIDNPNSLKNRKHVSVKSNEGIAKMPDSFSAEMPLRPDNLGGKGNASTACDTLPKK